MVGTMTHPDRHTDGEMGNKVNIECLRLEQRLLYCSFMPATDTVDTDRYGHKKKMKLPIDGEADMDRRIV